MRRNSTGVICGYKRAAGILAILAAWATLPLAAQVPSFTIKTIAGTGTAGFTGDGAAATAAQLDNPCAVAVDKSGNVFIADQVNSRVREVTTDGNIKTVAGTGTSGYTGDGGAATSAELSNPCGLAIDGSGNVFVSDATNHVVRKFTAGGNISTVAGTGVGGYQGDNAAANAAELNTPTGLAFDSAGNLYIGDTGNHVVRKVDTSGTITTYAGSGTQGYLGDGAPAGGAQLSFPTGLAIDSAGNLYIADTDNSVIRKVTPGGGNISTVAGIGSAGFSGDSGLATKATLADPRDVSLDAAGNLYIADTVNSRIRVVTPSGIITTVAGTGRPGFSGDGGPSNKAQLSFPLSMRTVANGSVYVVDTQNSDIRLMTPAAANQSAPPLISSGGVISASQFGAFHAAAPGSWIEIYGSGLAAAIRSWTLDDFSAGTAPTTLGGTSVMIGGQRAFVSVISPNQVNVQVPSNISTGSVELALTTAGGTTSPYMLQVNPTQPGIWAPISLQAAGMQYAGAVFASDPSTFALPAGAVSGLSSHAATPGETIVLYGTGFGPVTPNEGAGQLVQQSNQLTTSCLFSIGGIPATVSYAGLAPQAVGLYEFDLVVPNVPTSAAVPVTFNLGGVNGTQTLYIAVDGSTAPASRISPLARGLGSADRMRR